MLLPQAIDQGNKSSMRATAEDVQTIAGSIVAGNLRKLA
jgi:hypothetical protein